MLTCNRSKEYLKQLGVYEGALYYSKGVYRSAENSVMRYHGEDVQFNAQSRWIIYSRVMNLVGEECSFEQFLLLDETARKIFDERAASRSP